ncbi:MAG: response regulator transcription factor [Clostridia bacterium]|nr:response regulator transcription factor [Clostridia bacterium]
MSIHILICDDEPDIVKALEIYLRAEGYVTHAAFDGVQALEMLEQQEEIQLILLDRMMPRMDGIEAMMRIRDKYNIPIILLTAKSEEADLVLGLNLGADDYVTKPFRPVELMARIRSQLRRYTHLGGSHDSSEEREDVLELGGIRIDHRARKVTQYGEPIALTPKEYDILLFLVRHPGEVFSPKELYLRVWGDPPLGGEGTVAVHIRHLREKLEIDPAAPRTIKVVWGQGYKIESEESGAGRSE